VNNSDQKLPVGFGDFFLYDLIGSGGMAEIFLAKTFTGIGVERQIVIKRILPYLSDDENFGEMLISEAKLCASLSHANVVQTFDLGHTDDRYYIAMEYVEGFDLNKLLGLLARSKLALPLPFALYVITETLRGLDYAHRLCDESGTPFGIIHRDVSPTNILVSTEGNIKVCDFGIAKVTLSDLSAGHIDDYHLKGKVAYMAPEHLNGDKVDFRADLYAVGILLWELLQGRRLYKTKDENETLRRAKAADATPLADRGFPDFELLASMVKRALMRDPAKRFQTGQQFIRAIDDYMHQTGLIISQLKFAEFLMDNFGNKLAEQRRSREQSLADLLEYRNEQRSSAMPPAADPNSRRQADALMAAFDDTDEESYTGELPTSVPKKSNEDPSSPGNLTPEERFNAEYEALSTKGEVQKVPSPPAKPKTFVWIGGLLLLIVVALIVAYLLGF
jgi:eukaryotic-like serine/threonine-protein kinase